MTVMVRNAVMLVKISAQGLFIWHAFGGVLSLEMKRAGGDGISRARRGLSRLE